MSNLEDIAPTEWAKWRVIQEEIGRPGWSTSIFPIQVSMRAAAHYVVGITNDLFGIYQLTGLIRSVEPMTGAIQLREGATISQIVHLPTGVHIAMFDSLDRACTIASIMNRIDEWRGITSYADPTWLVANKRTEDMMYELGMIVDQSVTADIRGHTHCLVQMIPELLTVGRPERLS